jgi:hypothetical protein
MTPGNAILSQNHCSYDAYIMITWLYIALFVGYLYGNSLSEGRITLLMNDYLPAGPTGHVFF